MPGPATLDHPMPAQGVIGQGAGNRIAKALAAIFVAVFALHALAAVCWIGCSLYGIACTLMAH